MRLPMTKVLLVSPRHDGQSIWVYDQMCRALGAGYFTPPLGLLTVAALLPKHWDVSFIDRNFEDLREADLDRADVVMTGGMLTQRTDVMEIIRLTHARSRPVVVGGFDATASPDAYGQADYIVLGEAETSLSEFIGAWEAGVVRGVFGRDRKKANLAASPQPRYDLIRLSDYLAPGIQFSRGCPYTCEFCDIIEVYGRVPRVKTLGQIGCELDALFQAGHRGLVFFVDDNLIGDRRHARDLLRYLITWQRLHGYPFDFYTSLTINVCDDEELLSLFAHANFPNVFIGIESPEPATLITAKKKQNVAVGDLLAAVSRIHQAGIFVTAGFVIGFDSEKGNVAEAMIRFIDAAAITIAGPALLVALPDTQLSRRLSAEGRLAPAMPSSSPGTASVHVLNFRTLRPRKDILADYAEILAAVFSPQAYFSRLRAQCAAVRRPRLARRLEPFAVWQNVAKLLRLLRRMSKETYTVRKEFWHSVRFCLRTNPRALRYVLQIGAAYVDYGSSARRLIDDAQRGIGSAQPSG